MIHTFYDPCDERLELRSGFDRIDAADEPELPADPAWLEQYLFCLLENPSNRYAVQRLLQADLLELACPPDDHELCRLVALHLSKGTLVLVRSNRKAFDVTFDEEPAAQQESCEAEAQEKKEPEPKPRKTEEKIRDWKIECKHHAAGSRPFFERRTSLQVVPDKGKTKDTVTVHWRDDSLGSMPPSLALTTAGQPDAEAKRSGASGGYTAYKADVEYRGDLGEVRFTESVFWKALSQTTSYTFGPGPQAIAVEVYNPRRFKIEVNFPALKTLNAGYKYSVSSHAIVGDSLNKLSLTKKKTVKQMCECSSSGWESSSLEFRKRSATTTSTTTGGETSTQHEDKSETGLRLTDSVVFSRDDVALKIEAFDIFGGILEFIKAVFEIVKTVKAYAPQVGWYIDVDLQVMQGGLAAEWCWKEWEDHRVFRYVDVNASLEIFSIAVEIGIGVSAFTFKLQVFGQISGALAVEVSGTRYKPEGAPGFAFGSKGTITGALGARVEAGFLFKFEAKMETAIELDLTTGVNQPNRSKILNFDGGFVWTGIECSATGSVGMWGIAGTKKWKGTLVEKSDRFHFEWPVEKEYKPPFMSRNAIKSVMIKVLSDGWDIRVFTPSGNAIIPDRSWSLDEVAGAIADRIERDDAFHRTPEMVDALANAIRQDLDVLGEHFGRDWIEAGRFQAYLDNTVEGRSIKKHLDDGASPLRKLTG